MAALCGFSRFLGVAANNCVKRFGVTLLANQQFSSRSQPKRPPAKTLIYPKVPWIPQPPLHQTEIHDPTITNDKLTDELIAARELDFAYVIHNINELVINDNTSRLFAVVHICGKQFKVTENDIIVIQGYWPPNPGDQLKLEKVLLAGSTDFTLVGRPILNRELVTVDATVIEKTFSHTKTRFRMKPRKQYKRIHFYRIQHTMVRINAICINRKIDEKKEVEGLDRIY